MAHMIKQTITFSDGTETVINYQGVIENGVLIHDNMDENTEVTASEPVEEMGETSGTVEETVETPAEETPAESETA